MKTKTIVDTGVTFTTTAEQELPTRKEELIEALKSIIEDNAVFQEWNTRTGVTFGNFSIIDTRGIVKGTVPYLQKGDKNTQGFYMVQVRSDTSVFITLDDYKTIKAK
jgi:hemoglobin-like flavoprotein